MSEIEGGAGRRELIAAGLALALGAPSAAEAAATEGLGGAGDFAFLMGRWRVDHERLKRRLAGDTQWERFGGTCEALPLMGGQVNVDDNVIDLPAGRYRAATMRVFDPGARRWAIYWIDGRAGRLDAPVFGRFEAGNGLFFGDDLFEGRPIKVRFAWSTADAAAPRWEQACSADGGRTWETNWRMTFTRAA